jgi:hypothetical protein
MGAEGAFVIGSDFLVAGASPLVGALHTLTEVDRPRSHSPVAWLS